MFDVEIDGKQVRAEVSFLTAHIYEAEFQSDLIQDFFGVQGAQAPVEVDGEQIASIDFTKINWMAATKFLWAAVKTADETAPGYAAWMRKAKGANMWLVREQLAVEIADCFFRAGAAEQNPEGQE